MKAIEISWNGKVVCRAGLPKNGNLSAILNLIREPNRTKKKDWFSSLNVGGLSVEGNDYKFLRFIERDITERDTVSLRVVEVEKVSRPKSQRVETKLKRLKTKEKYLKQVTKELRSEK